MKVIWGKHVWKALHYIAVGYPNEPTEQQKKDYKMFYTLLKTVLPCNVCREHYTENLKQLPITDDVLKNNSSLIKWTIDLHNLINEQLGYEKLSYNDALKDISTYEICHRENQHNKLLNSLILFSIIIIIIFLFKK